MKLLTIPKLELQAFLLSACLAEGWNLISLINTCGTNVYVDRQPHRPSEAADYRQITSVSSKPTSRNSGLHDSRRTELRQDFWKSSWCWHTWVFSKCSFSLSQDKRQPVWTVNERFAKSKKNKFKSDQKPSENEKQEATAITANVANMASTFESKIYSLYEKLLRIVAYMLRSTPNFPCNRTKSGSNFAPAVLEFAQQKLHVLVQKESFSFETKFRWSLHKSARHHQFSISLFSLDRMDYFAQEDVPIYWKLLRLEQNLLWYLMVNIR